MRGLPDFIVFGAQKSGTSSLFRYLCELPQVARPFGQEPVFFSHEEKFGRGLDEYRQNFPLRVALGGADDRWPHRITGEASGEYLYYPAAPQRIAAVLPEARLIAVLRDPVDRTISQFFHGRKLGRESRELAQALTEEIESMTGEQPTALSGRRQFDPLGGGSSYIGRSLYVHHLDRWFRTFDSSRILLVQAEKMYREPALVLSTVADFLGLDPPPAGEYPRINAGTYSGVDEELRAWLADVFVKPNRELFDLLDRQGYTDFEPALWRTGRVRA